VPLYLQGLRSHLPRKHAEDIATLVDVERLVLQAFIGTAPWDHRPLVRVLVGQGVEQLGEPDGIIAFDPSSFLKRGTHSVGVKRQWCSHRGKVDNCQVGVFMGYVSRPDHALLDFRLGIGQQQVPDSCTFRHSSVVPFGQVIVKDDFHSLFEIGGVLAPNVVHRVQHPSRHLQAGRGVRTFDALPRDSHRREAPPLAGAREVRDHLVCERMVCGTVRRIRGHPPLSPKPMRQPLAGFLKQRVRRAGAAPTVPQHEQALRLGIGRLPRVLPPHGHTVATSCAGIVARGAVAVCVLGHHVLDAVGHPFPLACGAHIVVKGFHRLGGAGQARTVHMPPHCRLFRVDRNHRLARRLILAP
jgi:hypothetical protein